MSASEIMYWKEYFSIYPFTQDREDSRIALLASIMKNGQRTKNGDKVWDIDDFLPRYFKNQPLIEGKSIEQQRAEKRAFKERYQRALAENKRK